MDCFWIEANGTIVPMAQAQGEWTREAFIKFALIWMNDRYYVFCFHQDDQHSDQVKAVLGLYQLQQSAFIGAGTLLKPTVCQAQFNSPSCQGKFGYDRPSDATLQGSLLQYITGAIRIAGYGQ
jgi:hypothetical protein